MVEHIFMLETSVDHAAVVTKKVEQSMKGPVDDFDVDIVPEHLLLNAGLKQFPGHTVIAYFTWIRKLLKNFLMVFFEVMEKSGARSLHLNNGHLDDPEECLNGIVRLIDQLKSLHLALVLIIFNDLQQKRIFVFKAFINGTLGDAHLFGKRIHGHASDSVLPKQQSRFNYDSFSDFHYLPNFRQVYENFFSFFSFQKKL